MGDWKANTIAHYINKGMSLKELESLNKVDLRFMYNAMIIKEEENFKKMVASNEYELGGAK